MLRYIIKRTLWVIPTMVGVLIILFSLTYLMPGDPASVMLGPRATPELVAEINQRLHLDRAMPVRLGYYLIGIVKGDLGTSVWSGHKVSALIAAALPHTALLAVTSLGVAALIGILLGAFAAVRRDSPIGGGVTIVSLLGVAVPDFVAALLLMLLFCIQIPILPALGAGAEGDLFDIAKHLILPATALGIGWVGLSVPAHPRIHAGCSGCGLHSYRPGFCHPQTRHRVSVRFEKCRDSFHHRHRSGGG